MTHLDYFKLRTNYSSSEALGSRILIFKKLAIRNVEQTIGALALRIVRKVKI